MAISKADMEELKRLATNTYDSDKARIHRLIRGITDLTSENAQLKSDVKRLTEELAKKSD